MAERWLAVHIPLPEELDDCSNVRNLCNHLFIRLPISDYEGWDDIRKGIHMKLFARCYFYLLRMFSISFGKGQSTKN